MTTTLPDAVANSISRKLKQINEIDLKRVSMMEHIGDVRSIDQFVETLTDFQGITEESANLLHEVEKNTIESIASLQRIRLRDENVERIESLYGLLSLYLSKIRKARRNALVSLSFIVKDLDSVKKRIRIRYAFSLKLFKYFFKREIAHTKELAEVAQREKDTIKQLIPLLRKRMAAETFASMVSLYALFGPGGVFILPLAGASKRIIQNLPSSRKIAQLTD